MKPALEMVALAAHHDRATFACGVPALDTYLRQQATQDVRRYLASVWVLCPVGSVEVVGYYTLSALSVEPSHLPPTLTRRLPRYPLLPAALIGRLAVDERWRGQRLGQRLLLDALARCLRADLAAWLVLVDAKDETVGQFYARYGFAPLGGQTQRLYLPMQDVAQLVQGD